MRLPETKQRDPPKEPRLLTTFFECSASRLYENSDVFWETPKLCQAQLTDPKGKKPKSTKSL